MTILPTVQALVRKAPDAQTERWFACWMQFLTDHFTLPSASFAVWSIEHKIADFMSPLACTAGLTQEAQVRFNLEILYHRKLDVVSYLEAFIVDLRVPGQKTERTPTNSGIDLRKNRPLPPCPP